MTLHKESLASFGPPMSHSRSTPGGVGARKGWERPPRVWMQRKNGTIIRPIDPSLPWTLPKGHGQKEKIPSLRNWIGCSAELKFLLKKKKYLGLEDEKYNSTASND